MRVTIVMLYYANHISLWQVHRILNTFYAHAEPGMEFGRCEALELLRYIGGAMMTLAIHPYINIEESTAHTA